jgi:putative membrane-bound dehydrogenase-like protein
MSTLKTVYGIGLALVVLTACDKPVQQVTSLHLPDDLEATLWAESPMLYNPTNMDVDERGRIWVTEAVNYRNFNNDSTKHLHHGNGDRVVILEDTDQDGQADKSTVFVQDKDLVSPLGIAIIDNKVYVSCAPHLIVYTDHNGDDVPDEKEIFLTGFGGYDHDHSLHAVVGGPDGNLYFNTGNAGPHHVVAKDGWTLRAGSIYTGGTPYNTENQGNQRSDDGKVWVGGLALRIAPDGTGMKVMAHNFRNSYEVFVDSRGDMWQNDNDDQVVTCRTTWIMEGGNAGFFSRDGSRYWQADQRPGQDIFAAHWHQDDPGTMPAGDRTGAGSPTGVVLNEGMGLGEKYTGMLLSAEAGRNVIFAYYPKHAGSGFDLGERQNLIISLDEDNAGYVWNDTLQESDTRKWFRPSDVTIGTDGAMYIADWYDPIVGGHQMQDTIGYGRIYRITPKGKSLAAPAIDYQTINGQLEAFCNPAVNVRYTGAQKLMARGEEAMHAVQTLLVDPNPFIRSRALWLLARLGDAGKTEAEKMLSDADVDKRIVAYRALRSSVESVLPYASRMVNDPSPFVRREVVVSLRDIPWTDAKPLLIDLALQYDGKDRWFLETLGSAVEGHEQEFFDAVYERLNPDHVPATQWSDTLSGLAWRLHPPNLVNAFVSRANTLAPGTAEQTRALTALAFINTREAAEAMRKLAGSPQPEVAEMATYWLSFRQSNDWYSLLDWSETGIDTERALKVAAMKVRMGKILDEDMPFNEQKSNAQAMAKDALGGQMLLGLVAEGKLPQPLYHAVADLMRNNPDPAVGMQALLYFRPAGDNPSYSIPGIVGTKPDIGSGAAIFQEKCSACHRVKDSGAAVGPELTAINQKFDVEALLDAIINPSAGIVFGYEAWTISTSDGLSYFGFLVAEGEHTVVIKDLGGTRHTIALNKITSRHKMEKSLMPDPAALGLTDKELADVSGYLMGL